MDDVLRFAQFCKIRSEIRGSGKFLIVGIDIAKDKHHAFFGTPNGKSLWRRLIFTNDIVGYNRLVDQVNTLTAQHQLQQVVFGLRRDDSGNAGDRCGIDGRILFGPREQGRYAAEFYTTVKTTYTLP